MMKYIDFLRQVLYVYLIFIFVIFLEIVVVCLYTVGCFRVMHVLASFCNQLTGPSTSNVCNILLPIVL